MGLSAAVVRELVAAGVTGDALVAACERIEAATIPARSKGAERTARWRERKEQRHGDVTSVTCDGDPSPLDPPLEVSPAPLPKTPPIIPPSRTPFAREAAIPSEESLAFEAYNDIAAELGLSKAQLLTNERKAKIRQRLTECGGLTGWLEALGKIRGSPFLTGDNDRGWKASLDFLLQRASFTRLLEGSYDRPDRQRPAAASKPTMRDGFDILDTVVAEAYRRENGHGEQGSEEDPFGLSGLRQSAA